MDMIISCVLLNAARISKSTQRNINHVTRTVDNAPCSVPIIKKEVVQMPQHEWISGVQLIPENQSYKVDGSGRVIIPAHLRSKFKIEVGDMMEYYTTFVDNSWFLCVRLDKKLTEELRAAEEEAHNEENI
jgi:bifunctional DNA-binding transcriptional regulator/antitoxin component of YhaV-PrlF toxin-antitoxin module